EISPDQLPFPQRLAKLLSTLCRESRHRHFLVHRTNQYPHCVRRHSPKGAPRQASAEDSEKSRAAIAACKADEAQSRAPVPHKLRERFPANQDAERTLPLFLQPPSAFADGPTTVLLSPVL